MYSKLALFLPGVRNQSHLFDEQVTRNVRRLRWKAEPNQLRWSISKFSMESSSSQLFLRDLLVDFTKSCGNCRSRADRLPAAQPSSGWPPLLILNRYPVRCLKNSTWRRRFFAALFVVYGPPRFFPFSDTTLYPSFTFRIMFSSHHDFGEGGPESIQQQT